MKINDYRERNLVTMVIKDGKSECPHKNHRGRVRKAVAENGFDGMNPHNVIEFLLFFPIARRDTNETAHAVIQRFGSVGSALDAAQSELCECAGIGEGAARFLRILGELYHMSPLTQRPDEERLDAPEKRRRRVLLDFIESGRSPDDAGGSIFLLGPSLALAGKLDIGAAQSELTSEIVKSRSIEFFSETHGMTPDSTVALYRRLRRTALLLGARYDGNFTIAPDLTVTTEAGGDI